MKKLKTLACVLLVAAIVTSVSASGWCEQDEAGAVSSIMTGDVILDGEGEENDVSFSFDSAQSMFDSMQVASSNDKYELRFDSSTAAVAVLDKATGAIYTSNPYNAEMDPNCTGEIEKSLESQLVLTYIDIKVREQKLMLYSSSDCVSFGQYSYKTYENGVAFTMTIGKDAGSELSADVLTAERYDEIYSQLSERGQMKFEMFYTKYSLAEITDETERADMLERYPALEKQDLYISIELSEREKRDLEEYLKDAGYTIEKMNEDYEALGIVNEASVLPTFKMTIEYALDENGLSVNIPNSSIEFDNNVYQLLTVSVLQYFGADAPTDSGDGYLLFPDGSGAVININNQDENRRPIISSKVYGFNAADEQDTAETEGEQVYLPVYGIRRNDKTAFFTIITEGDAVSELSARLGNPNSAFYTVYNTFTISDELHMEVDSKVSSLGSRRLVYMYEKNAYKGNLSLHYSFLTGENADYSGMATEYRSYLLKNGMTEKENTTAVTLGIDSLGTSLYDETFLGFGYKAQAKYTTYSDDRDVLKYFADNGIDNINLSLMGWQKYGLDSMVANKVRIASVLGGKSGLADLLQYASELNVDVYPEVDMLFVNNDKAFDGFSPKKNGIRRLDSTLGGISAFDFSISQFEKLQYAITPSKYNSYFSSFFKGYSKINNDKISLTTLGSYLNSDFSKKSQGTNRSETLATVKELLAAYSEDYSMSFSGANSYILSFASQITDIPTSCSGFLGETYSVPFLQMVISGCIEYQSAPINLSDDMQTALLQCVESRTSPDFVIAVNNVEKLKNTEYNKYYSIRFDVLKDDMTDAYKFVSGALEKTEGASLVAHERIADGVTVSTYSNGVKVYVNYNSAAYTANGITVDGAGYLTVE